jgi:hypothetical protein
MDLPSVAAGVRSTLSHPNGEDRGHPNLRLGGPLRKKGYVCAATSRSRTASTKAAAGTGGLLDAL